MQNAKCKTTVIFPFCDGTNNSRKRMSFRPLRRRVEKPVLLQGYLRISRLRFTPLEMTEENRNTSLNRNLAVEKVVGCCGGIRQNIGLHKCKKYGENCRMSMGSFPHYPQVFPQVKPRKPMVAAGTPWFFGVFLHSSTKLCKTRFGFHNTF